MAQGLRFGAQVLGSWSFMGVGSGLSSSEHARCPMLRHTGFCGNAKGKSLSSQRKSKFGRLLKKR